MAAPQPAASSSAARAGRSPLLFIFLTVFIDLLGFGIVIPLLPIYSKAYGATELEIGLLFSCFSGMQFLFAPMWGRLSDRIGRRPVLIGGLVGTALSYVLFANAHSMLSLSAARLLGGFFGGNISSAQAYIADVTTPANRAKGMALIGAAFGLGFMVGPLVGGQLAQVSMATPGYVAAGLSFSAALFGYFKLVEPERHAAEASRTFGVGSVRLALSDRRVGTLLLLNFIALFAFACFEVMLIPFGLAKFPHAFGLTTPILDASLDDIVGAAPIASYYLAGIGVISALIQGGLIRRLVPRFGETRLIIVGPFVLGLGLALVGVASSWWLVVAGCVVMPFGFALNNPSLAGLLSRASPADKQGAYMGINQSIASLARVCGPPVAGSLFKLTPHTPFLAAAGVLMLATWIATRYRARYGVTFSSAEATAGPAH